jgi:hypothetical protein
VRCMMFGIFDTVDRCWLGTNDTGTGPKTFEEELLARCAAQLADVRLGWPPGRSRARAYDATGVTLKDELQTKMDTLNALRLVERGVRV